VGPVNVATVSGVEIVAYLILIYVVEDSAAPTVVVPAVKPCLVDVP
jgi:hypothetical protein